jgi:hypothetical protein
VFENILHPPRSALSSDRLTAAFVASVAVVQLVATAGVVLELATGAPPQPQERPSRKATIERLLVCLDAADEPPPSSP